MEQTDVQEAEVFLVRLETQEEMDREDFLGKSALQEVGVYLEKLADLGFLEEWAYLENVFSNEQ